MFTELFTALFKAGLPVGLAAYGLMWWALRNGYVSERGNVKAFEAEVKRLAKDKKERRQGDMLHKKWLAMGGGFYGVVAVLTWFVIEFAEIRDFIAGFGSFSAFISQLSIGTLIELFIGALINSFMALAWPMYWLSDIQSQHVWIWFLVAYGGYWAGSNLAMKNAQKAAETDLE